MRTSSSISQLYPEGDGRRSARRVIACIDRSEHARKIVPHAFAVAKALDIPVILLQVLEAPPSTDFRLDPIEWNIRRQESRRALTRLADAGASGVEAIDTELVEGQTADEICRRAGENSADLIVLGTHGERGAGKYGLGSTARSVLERASGNVLLVPVATATARVAHYRRILVPVDGSSWSVSVLPLAVRLAQNVDAELILVYVVPVPEFIETSPLEAEDLELRARVIDRNERVARSYLNRVRARVADRGLKVQAVTLRGDDIRACLAKFIDSEHVDLVALSARGHGHPRVSDVPYGNVAAYIMTHSPVPVLVARPTGLSGDIQTATRREAARPSVRPAG